MTKGWFRRKSGRGRWEPCTWQGWLCVGLAVVLATLDFIRLDARSHSVSDTLRPWILDTLFLGGALLLVAWLTREKPDSGLSGQR